MGKKGLKQAINLCAVDIPSTTCSEKLVQNLTQPTNRLLINVKCLL